MMEVLEEGLNWLFWVIVTILVVILVGSIVGIVIEVFSDSPSIWTCLFLVILIVCCVVASYYVGGAVIYRVPAVTVAVPESLITGRFAPESQNECGCSVPIDKPTLEGTHLKRWWHKIHLISRKIETTPMEEQKYDVKRGQVIVSVVLQWRIAHHCAYRALAVTKEAAEAGMKALVDQVITRKLIKLELEQALQLKTDLVEEIEKALTGQVEVDDGSGNKVFRTLWGEPVSVAEHNFGVEITDISVDRIDPTEELRQKLADLLMEDLEKTRAKSRMDRFEDQKKRLKAMFDDLSNEKLAHMLNLIEGLTTEEKKVYSIADLPEIAELVTNSIKAFRGKKGGA